MRQLGSILKESDAQRFAAFLVAEGINAHSEPEKDTFVIWVRDEKPVETRVLNSLSSCGSRHTLDGVVSELV